MSNALPAKSGPISGLPANDLLAALPQEDYRALTAILRPTPLQKGRLVQRQGELFERIVFPGSGLYSVRKVMADGRTIELAKLGRETLIAPAVFSEGSGASLAEIAVLVPDTAALVAGADAFRECLEHSPKLRELVESNSRQIVRAVAQIGACNGVHSVEERLCLGLLVACDRMGTDEIPLTQDTFARALAVRRPTVSLVMNSLQRAGLIECGRGRIRLISRKGLEAISCECYAVLQNGAQPGAGVHKLSA